MKKLIIACILLVLFSSAALAVTIDGPANVRDNPKGKVILSLNDGAEVFVRGREGKWYVIIIKAVLEDETFSENGGLKKGTVLYDGSGNEMGIFLDKTYIPLRRKFGGNKSGISIKAYTFEGNVVEKDFISEEEFVFLEKVGVETAYHTQQAFDNSDDAKRFIGILLKCCIAQSKIFFCEEVELRGRNSKQSKSMHCEDFIGGAIESAIGVLNPNEDKEAYDLIVRVLNEAGEHYIALKKALRMLKFAHDPGVIPILKEFINHPDHDVRLEAARSLLTLGDLDTSLPVFEKFLREGKAYVLSDIRYHVKKNKDLTAKGLEMMNIALESDNNEVRAEAIYTLIDWNREGIAKQDVKKLEILSNQIGYEILKLEKWDAKALGYRPDRALKKIVSAISALNTVNSFPLLKKISEDPRVEKHYIVDDTRRVITALKLRNCIEPEDDWRGEVPKRLPENLPMVQAGQTVKLRFKAINQDAKRTASSVEVRIYDPERRYLRHRENIPVNIGPGNAVEVEVSYKTCPTAPAGIWLTEYTLLHLSRDAAPKGSNLIIEALMQSTRDAKDGRFVVVK
jgi:hypothetical protein